MNVDDRPIDKITDHFHSFYVEAFNIFALGDDRLPHLICACPNKNFAKALCGLLKFVCAAGSPSPLKVKMPVPTSFFE